MTSEHLEHSGDEAAVAALPRASTAPAGRLPAPRVWLASLLLICGALALLVLFRPFFSSRFDLTAGDPADGRFEIVILEHWVKVFHGQAHIASPNFFYPVQGVLGYSDAYLGLALVHAAFRYVGIDRYLAVQFAVMLLTGVGILAMYSLMRGIPGFARSTAAIGALLFLASNMYYIYVVHAYILISVVTAPGVLALAARYWQQREAQPARARAYLCLCGILLSLIFFTSFYIAWFLVVCSAFFLAFYLICSVFAQRSFRPAWQALGAVRKDKWNLLLGAFVFLLSMAPFFALYLPAMRRTGQRSLVETLSYMPSPLGIFDVGPYNLVWGKLSARIESLISPGGMHEHPVGWPLLTVLVFLATVLYCGRELWRSRSRDDQAQNRGLLVVSAIAVTCLTLWTAAVRFGDQAQVWTFFCNLIPGAAAIRVPQRINLVLNIGVVIVCMFGVEALWRTVKRRGRILYIVPVLLVAALLVEQLNFMPTHLISRRREARKFSVISPPPAGCSEFYVSNWSRGPAEMVARQMDAILLAQQYGIPTINGASSWFPQGWELLHAPRGQVGEKALEWARLKGISQGLCALNTTTGEWTSVDINLPAPVTHVSDAIPGEVTNPGFEDDDLAWWDPFQDVHASQNSDQVRSGSYSLAESDGVGSVTQDVTGLQPGRRYRVSVWVSASAGATAGSQMVLWEPGTNVPLFSETLHPGTAWQPLANSITVGEAGTLRIHLFRTQGTGTIYWDDVQIKVDEGHPDASK